VALQAWVPRAPTAYLAVQELGPEAPGLEALELEALELGELELGELELEALELGEPEELKLEVLQAGPVSAARRCHRPSRSVRFRSRSSVLPSAPGRPTKIPAAARLCPKAPAMSVWFSSERFKKPTLSR
jgi:hypothetical protein